MSDLTYNGDLEGLSAEVTATDQHTAERAAKLALIEAGRAPGHVIYAEQTGADTWEVVYTNRPLRADQSWEGATRIGNAGSRADFS